jgi:hypothetical protein
LRLPADDGLAQLTYVMSLSVSWEPPDSVARGSERAEQTRLRRLVMLWGSIGGAGCTRVLDDLVPIFVHELQPERVPGFRAAVDFDAPGAGRSLSLSFNRAGLIRPHARWPRASTLDRGTASG